MTEARFVVKPLVLDMMAGRFPEYRYAFTKDPRYFFRSQPTDGIYDFVVFQRDGQAGALYIDLASTYDSEWEGFEPFPLGRWKSLAELVKVGRKGYVDALENWYFYRNAQEQLQSVLSGFAKDLVSHGKPFFSRVRKLLRSDRVLQAGLGVLREAEPVSIHSLRQLDADLKLANHRLPDTRNGTLDQMVRDIKASLSFLARSRADEGYVRKVACELLFLGRKNEVRADS